MRYIGGEVRLARLVPRRAGRLPRRSHCDAAEALMWDPRAELVVTAMDDSVGRPSPARTEFVLYARPHAQICRYNTNHLPHPPLPSLTIGNSNMRLSPCSDF